MKNLYNNLLLILGLGLVSVILFNRLIKIRLPKEFDNLPLILFFIIFMKFYKYFFGVINQKEKYTFIKILIKHPYNIFIIMQNSMVELDIYLKNRVPFYNEHMRYTDQIIKFSMNVIFNQKYKIILITVIFSIMPQIIVTYSFIYDILIEAKFLYFYKVLWLLIFPLLLKYYIYSVKTFIATNLDGLENDLILKIILTENITNHTIINDFEPITIREWQNLLLTTDSKKYTCYNNLSNNTLQSFGDDLLSANATLEYCIDFLNLLFLMFYYIDIYDRIKMKLELPISFIKHFIFFTNYPYKKCKLTATINEKQLIKRTMRNGLLIVPLLIIP